MEVSNQLARWFPACNPIHGDLQPTYGGVCNPFTKHRQDIPVTNQKGIIALVVWMFLLLSLCFLCFCMVYIHLQLP